MPSALKHVVVEKSVYATPYLTLMTAKETNEQSKYRSNQKRVCMFRNSILNLIITQNNSVTLDPLSTLYPYLRLIITFLANGEAPLLNF